MEHNRHRNARTSLAMRREIRESPESLRALAKRLGVNPKTVAKWKLRPQVEDLPSGPRSRPQLSLSADEEAIIVGFREHTQLPLDDCLYSLQARIPHLTRSTLHRCLARHGISRLPAGKENVPDTSEATALALGNFHIDVAQVPTAEGPIQLFVAIDQISKFVFVHLSPRAAPAQAAAFILALAQAAPHPVRTVLTHATSPFVTRRRSSAFSRACHERGIEHRLTSVRHPWTSGKGAQVGRMMRTASPDLTDYQSHAHLADDLESFVWAYNHRRRLKTLGGLPPCGLLERLWRAHPDLFLRKPGDDQRAP